MGWVKKVQFRDLLEEYNELSGDELAEIERIKPLWVERFNSIPELKRFAKGLGNVKTESGFNRWLSGVYDYCDRQRIWVEL